MKFILSLLLLICFDCYSQFRYIHISFEANIDYTFLSDVSLVAYSQISGKLRKTPYPNTHSKSLCVGVKANLNKRLFSSVLFGLENFDRPNLNTIPIRIQVGYTLPWLQKRVSPYAEYNYKIFMGSGTQSGHGMRLGLKILTYRLRSRGQVLNSTLFYAKNRIRYGTLETFNHQNKFEFKGFGLGFALTF